MCLISEDGAEGIKALRSAEVLRLRHRRFDLVKKTPVWLLLRAAAAPKQAVETTAGGKVRGR